MIFNNILNSLQAISNLKVPQYHKVNDIPNNRNQTGSITYVNGSFY